MSEPRFELSVDEAWIVSDFLQRKMSDEECSDNRIGLIARSLSDWTRQHFNTRTADRWINFTGDELSDIHNALLHAQDGTGTAPSIIEEIREEWKRIDAEAT